LGIYVPGSPAPEEDREGPPEVEREEAEEEEEEDRRRLVGILFWVSAARAETGVRNF
jgi:hypothetical protein